MKKAFRILSVLIKKHSHRNLIRKQNIVTGEVVYAQVKTKNGMENYPLDTGKIVDKNVKQAMLSKSTLEIQELFYNLIRDCKITHSRSPLPTANFIAITIV